MSVHDGLRETVLDVVIADLLGVPLEDHANSVGFSATRSSATSTRGNRRPQPPEVAGRKFRYYITDRGREPRADVLTELAAATYPDGSVPDVEEVVKLATFLFAAGHGDDDQAAQHRDAGDGRASRHPAVASRQPWADPRIPRRGVADGEPREESLPVGEAPTTNRGSGHPRGHDHHVASGCKQPRPREIREPARVSARPP